MNNNDEKLNKFITELNIAEEQINRLIGYRVESLKIQLALCEVFKIDSMDTLALLNLNISHQEIVENLKNYNFSEIICEFELEESILPEGTISLLTEQSIRSKGEIWRVHKNDLDPFPSSPHAHNCNSGFSLHLGTGEFFDKRTSKGFLNCKKLKIIREKISDHTLPALSQRCS